MTFQRKRNKLQHKKHLKKKVIVGDKNNVIVNFFLSAILFFCDFCMVGNFWTVEFLPAQHRYSFQ